jgi:hypothetical protein
VRTIDADALKADFRLNFGSVHDAVIACQIVDRQPTLTPPNEALTMEELQEMDGEPVWVDTIKRWGIVRVCGYGISVLTKSGEYDVTRMKFYRRPPEGEEYT